MTPANAYKIFGESPHSRKPSRSTYLPFRPANLGPSRAAEAALFFPSLLAVSSLSLQANRDTIGSREESSVRAEGGFSVVVFFLFFFFGI